MPDTAVQVEYELIFHGYASGPAGVEAKCGGKPMAKMLFAKGGAITISAIGPDGSKSSIISVEIDFQAQDGAPPSPLGDGKSPRYVWRKSEGGVPAMIGQTDGAWKFTAKLVRESGEHYMLPDPEFQVGDGAAAGAPMRDA